MSTILTGDRPTGPLHLGHYIGSLKKRVKLQQKHQQFVMVADLQALTDNVGNSQKINDNIIEVALDYLSVGIDPKQSTIFLQSLVPELTELTFHYLNLVTLARLERNPTVKSEIQSRNFQRNTPVGFYCYPISQAADITAFKADVVPVGADQKPMIEQTNEIVKTFNRLYKTDVLVTAECLFGECPRLSGIHGKQKMSKSLNNAIFLKDSPELIQKKVKQMYTDPNHLHISDPGKTDGNVVFEYLDIFDENTAELDELKKHYQKGGLGDSKLKQRLSSILIEHLEPIQKIRRELEKDKASLMDSLIASSEKARETAANTLAQVREVMGLRML